MDLIEFVDSLLLEHKKNIVQKISSQLKKHYYEFKTIPCFEHSPNNIALITYKEGSTTWTTWSRQARGTIIYYDDEKLKSFILKKSLDRGIEVLTKSQNVHKTESYDKKKQIIYTDIQQDTINKLNNDEKFNCSLTMKVDGSQTVITLYPLNGRGYKIISDAISDNMNNNITKNKTNYEGLL